MIGRMIIVFLALAGTAEAKCVVPRNGLPPAMVMNVRDEDCAAFQAALKNNEPVAGYFSPIGHEDTIQPGPVKAGDRK